MNRLFLIVGVCIAIIALMFLSQGIRKASPTDEDLQQQAQKDAQKTAPQAAPPAPKPTAPEKPSVVTLTLPAEETVGIPAAAKHHILVGWVYDQDNQAKPEMLTVPLQAIRDYVQRSSGSSSAEIVNLDVPVEDRSPAAQTVTDLGVVEDGRAVVTDNLSSEPTNPQQLARMLANTVK